MKFSELVRLFENHGFKLAKEKGRFNPVLCEERMAPVDSAITMGRRKCPPGLARRYSKPLESRGRDKVLIELPYSLVIEATEEPDYFGFYSLELEGFSGIGHSVEDCLFKAKWGMAEHVDLLKERGLPVPARNPDPTVVIQNERKSA